MTYATSVWDVLLVLLLVGGSWIYKRAGPAVDRLRSVFAAPEPSAVEKLQAEYAAVDSGMTEEEFESRLDLALDSRAVVIRDRVEEVDGVGPERSALIADRFGNIEAVRRADVGDLTDIHGIGPSTAEDILTHFSAN